QEAPAGSVALADARLTLAVYAGPAPRAPAVARGRDGADRARAHQHLEPARSALLPRSLPRGRADALYTGRARLLSAPRRRRRGGGRAALAGGRRRRRLRRQPVAGHPHGEAAVHSHAGRSPDRAWARAAP